MFIHDHSIQEICSLFITSTQFSVFRNPSFYWYALVSVFVITNCDTLPWSVHTYGAKPGCWAANSSVSSERQPGGAWTSDLRGAFPDAGTPPQTDGHTETSMKWFKGQSLNGYPFIVDGKHYWHSVNISIFSMLKVHGIWYLDTYEHIHMDELAI